MRRMDFDHGMQGQVLNHPTRWVCNIVLLCDIPLNSVYNTDKRNRFLAQLALQLAHVPTQGERAQGRLQSETLRERLGLHRNPFTAPHRRRSRNRPVPWRATNDPKGTQREEAVFHLLWLDRRIGRVYTASDPECKKMEKKRGSRVAEFARISEMS